MAFNLKLLPTCQVHQKLIKHKTFSKGQTNLSFWIYKGILNCPNAKLPVLQDVLLSMTYSKNIWQAAPKDLFTWVLKLDPLSGRKFCLNKTTFTMCSAIDNPPFTSTFPTYRKKSFCPWRQTKELLGSHLCVTRLLLLWNEMTLFLHPNLSTLKISIYI